MADISSLGGSTRGNEQQATDTLRSMGIDNPSSGLVRFLAYNDVGYSAGDAARLGLPMTPNIIQGQRQEAIRPAVESYQASKPEVQQAFDVRTGQLAAEKQPLIDRYQTLLDELTGRETKETGREATALAREYGKRGIPLSSGVYEQNLNQKLGDISQFYGVQRKETDLAREADLRDLTNKISNLTTQRVSALRDIDNKIAEMQAGAGNQAITDALTMYREDLNRKFESRFDDLDRQIKEKSLKPAAPEYKTVEFGNNLYSFNPATNTLSSLAQKAGGGSTLNPVTQKLIDLITKQLGGQTNNLSTFQEDVSTTPSNRIGDYHYGAT